MSFIGLFTLLLAHFITGRGLLQLLQVKVRLLFMVCLSFISGTAIASFIPFFLELAHQDITPTSVGAGLAVVTVLFSIPWLLKFKQWRYPTMADVNLPEIYEWPFFAIFGYLIFLSVWRCYFYPPNARDMLSGPEVMAELALKEKHIINSLFTVDLQSTNNYLKPPFITSLQIIYKMFVQPVGQLWLSVFFVNFIVILFALLRERLHKLVACFALLFFFAMPEVFGYTYLMLFDYSNMVFLFLGMYFLHQFFEEKLNSHFYLSVFLFTIATYIRTETLILIGFATPLLIFNMYKDKIALPKIAINTVVMMAVPAIVYFLCMNVFVKHYIPIKYDVSNDINKNLGDLGPFFTRLSDISTKLLFDPKVGVIYYCYFPQLFILVAVIDAIAFRKYSKEAVTALYGIGMVYVGLAFIGYLLPLADLMHTTKRGLFKLFPLVMLYYRNSGVLLYISAKLTDWEQGKSDAPKTATKPLPKKPIPVKA